MGRKSNAKWERRLAGSPASTEKDRRSTKAATIGSVAMSCALFLFPPSFGYLLSVLALLEALLVYGSWDCWGFARSTAKRISFICLSTLIVMGLGYTRWPRMTISPEHVTFSQPFASFHFRIRNRTADDAYDVAPVLHLSGTFNPALVDIRVERPNLAAFFGPTGIHGMVCKDLKGGYVAFPVIPRLVAGEDAEFVVMYKGDSKPEITADEPRINRTPPPNADPHEIGDGKWSSNVQIVPPVPTKDCQANYKPNGNAVDQMATP